MNYGQSQSCLSWKYRDNPVMARLARRVVPDLPHHVTQRGNRLETIFFPTTTIRPI